ncbi:hypothetical protein [Acinetobacter sp. YH12140]|uniref:hypothetical protein n=1 Tax=Acinetobacter sp. YH12140 TaxID=2601124 RepID=UPI0015D32FC3|nr:hypothetical protein [Acinetobacter sp. YH12140]
MKKIMICFAWMLAACSQEEAALTSVDDVATSTQIQTQHQMDIDPNLANATKDTNSEFKAYFIHVKILSLDGNHDPQTSDGGVVYFHETTEQNPKESFLKQWEEDPEMQVDYKKMTAISKTKNLIFYIQDQIDEIPPEQAWMYREEN